jgi:2-iminobutanoate/2-iminopropanoate deaminase
MEQRNINPWQWQDPLAFSQAVEVTSVGKVLYCAGQTAVDAEGRPLFAGDMRRQIEQAFDNLNTVLAKAGFALNQVVRLNYYTTNMAVFNAEYDVVVKRLAAACVQPAGTLLGVATLAFPELLIEIEATAVQ